MKPDEKAHLSTLARWCLYLSAQHFIGRGRKIQLEASLATWQNPVLSTEGAVEMAQLLKCSLCKHEDHSMSPRTQVKCWVAHL